jgi:hypothetical protein
MALQEGVLLTLPHYDNSLDRLAPIQAASKQGTHPLGLPVIVHPQAQMLGNLQVKAPNYREYRRRFPAGIHYQLTPELLPAWGINTQEPEGIADGLAEAQHRFGLDDPVLDSMWFFATRGGQQFEDPFGLARALSRRGKVAGLQINWNADNSADPEQTTENLERSMAGELHHTPEGQLIHTVVAAANQPVHRLDIEARSKSMATAARKTNNGTWQQATKKIATAARAIAANAAR